MLITIAKMKTLFIVIIPILFLSCLKPLKEHPAIGNWYKCDRDGSYSEFKITKDYYLWMNSSSDDINIFRNKVIDCVLVISELKNGFELLKNNDTLLTLSHSNDKIILKSNSYTTSKVEIIKANFEIEAIDSTNLDSWKKKSFN